MEFITLNTGKKRQMVFLPEVNPNSLLLFFEQGSSGWSWSLRDYSVAHRVSERYARNFGWSANEVRSRARCAFDAPTVDTKSLTFWHDYTQCGNALVLKDAATSISTTHLSAEPGLIAVKPEQTATFPVLNSTALLASPKASKRLDLERILRSQNSEDWVTWNLLNLILLKHPVDWYKFLVSAALASNSKLNLSIETTDQAQLEFWRRVPAPAAYERASRTRMRQACDPAVAARSRDPKPVEGDSEIDAVVRTKRHLIFVEAKLGSDINMRTTYDPARNQIVRNIDCLLESAADKEPFFWMFVRDAGPGRVYCQLIDQYKNSPALLACELPHRDSATLTKVAERLTVIRWQDLAESILEVAEGDTSDIRAVKEELKRRVVCG